jgi:membrane protease YdiL (CAAX protease family)
VQLVGRVFAGATAGPHYPPDERDLEDISLFGLRFPLRASVAILATTALIVIDLLGWLSPVSFGLPDPGSPSIDASSVQRFVLFLLVPVLIVTVGFRDHPSRYGLSLGDWRWGAGLLIAGLVVMLPIILGLSSLEEFRRYYDTAGRPAGALMLDHLVELVPAEFLLRGFLMFALWRRIGPLALVVQLVPFVLTHVGKPEIELWSTFIGGSVFAWLNWRTGSILYSAIGHVYVLTLMELAVGGAAIAA